MEVSSPVKGWILKEIGHGRKVLAVELYRCSLCGNTFKAIRMLKAR